MFSVTIREKSGQVYTFHFDKPEIMIGRVKGNDVILPKQNISKRHALVRSYADSGFVVEDLTSTNGTYVNGHRINGPVEITSEDKVYLGDFVMQFFNLTEPQRDQEPETPSDLDLESEPMPELPPAPDPAPIPAPESTLDSDHFLDVFEEFQEVATDSKFDEGEPALLVEEEENDALEALDQLLDESAKSRHKDISVASTPPSLFDDMEEVDDMGATRAVAAVDPDQALEAMDSFRMTGPVEGLGDALSGASAQSFPDLSPANRSNSDPRAFNPASSNDAAQRLIDELGSKRSSAKTGTSTPRRMSPAADQAPVKDAYVLALADLYDRSVNEFEMILPRGAALLSEEQWGTLEDQVLAFVDSHASDEHLRGQDIARLKRDLVYELAGLGPLEALLDDETIESIEVNGPSRIYTTREGERTLNEARFSGQHAFQTAVERLAGATEIELTAQTSSATGTLSDGTSVLVVWPPLCPGGPVLLLHKPQTSALTLDDLVQQGRVTGAVASQLRAALRDGRSVAISGPAGSGRHAVLNAMALEIPHDQRIVVTEDVTRVPLAHENVIRLDGASASQRGSALIGLAAALRPDWLLLGAMNAAKSAELLDLAGDEIAPWIALFHGKDAEDPLRLMVHGYAVHHAGVPLKTCEVRTAGALDLLAVFGGDDQKRVLDQIFEVKLDALQRLERRSLLNS